MRIRRFELLITRVKGEFVEMPGLRLTVGQGARLWGLERDECGALLDTLVNRGFLTAKPDGKYRRATEGVAPDIPFRPAKASLKSEPSTVRSASTPASPRAAGRSSRD